MATKEETRMYDAAVNRVKELEISLSEANGEQDREDKEKRMEAALKRLENIKIEKPPEPEDEEEEEDQCPNCGVTLQECEDNTYYCPACNGYFEDEEDE